MIEVHGIKNCDTVKKALKWLEQHSLDFQFRDVRQQPLTESEAKQWLEAVGVDGLINKRSATYRQLSDQQKQLTDQAQLATLLVQNPTLFKRPLVSDEHGIHVGFKADTWQQRYAEE